MKVPLTFSVEHDFAVQFDQHCKEHGLKRGDLLVSLAQGIVGTAPIRLPKRDMWAIPTDLTPTEKKVLNAIDELTEDSPQVSVLMSREVAMSLSISHLMVMRNMKSIAVKFQACRSIHPTLHEELPKSHDLRGFPAVSFSIFSKPRPRRWFDRDGNLIDVPENVLMADFTSPRPQEDVRSMLAELGYPYAQVDPGLPFP